jgi:hypothetical protein
MAKWIFALLLVSAGAQARELVPPTDGCAVLNDIVYEEVTASRWGITGADLVHTNMSEPSIVICTNTAQTVSKAFAQAMRVIGSELEWQGSVDRREEICLSGFIEQCLPRGRGVLQPLWHAVSKTVLAAMPEGSAADRSIFNRDSMRLAVRASLRARGMAIVDSLCTDDSRRRGAPGIHSGWGDRFWP